MTINSKAAAPRAMGASAADVADFAELIDDYQCAQKDGTIDDRAKARIALLNAYRRALLAQPEPSREVEDAHPDDAAVDRFSAAMKAKMAASRAKGRTGWDDAEQCPPEFLARSLIDHLYKGDPVDVGNFAMMLFNRQGAGRALAEAAPHAASRDIAGALFDFCGHLTSMPRTIVLGAAHLATPIAYELREWAAKRNLALHPADVERWNATMSTPPAAGDSHD